MITYEVTIKTIAPYLQAKFGDEAKEGLKVRVGKKAKVEDGEEWKSLMYFDENGIYIPAEQFEGALEFAGWLTKGKRNSNFRNIVKSYLSVSPRKIYLGKTAPDFLNTSYPKRKDGMRVKLVHPAFNEGLEVRFDLQLFNEEALDNKTLETILEKAGMEAGIGAWRPRHGRFVIEKVVVKD